MFISAHSAASFLAGAVTPGQCMQHAESSGFEVLSQEWDLFITKLSYHAGYWRKAPLPEAGLDARSSAGSCKLVTYWRILNSRTQRTTEPANNSSASQLCTATKQTGEHVSRSLSPLNTNYSLSDATQQNTPGIFPPSLPQDSGLGWVRRLF